MIAVLQTQLTSHAPGTVQVPGDTVLHGLDTLAAAATVCQAELDTLQALVDRSLVRVNGGRYWMLQTLREYANRAADDGTRHLGPHFDPVTSVSLVARRPVGVAAVITAPLGSTTEP